MPRCSWLFLWIVAWFAVAVCWAQLAQAEPGADVAAPASPMDTARREAAKEHFQRGLVLARDAQQWDAALAEFLASRELFPTRSATRNAAVALKQLGRYAEALLFYELLLRDFAEGLPPDQLAAFQSELSAVWQHVGELEIGRTESDASVVVDGQQRGTTPLKDVIRVDAGTHVVRVSKEGFEPFELNVSVAGGRRRVIEPRFKRLGSSGTLVIQEASGTELEVMLDAARVGRTPWRGTVAPGVHAVLLRDPAAGSTRGTVPSSIDVRAGELATLTLRAVDLVAELRLEPTPSNASVFVDGVAVGNGIWEGRLPSGLHRIEAGAPGHVAFRQDIRFQPRQRQVVRARLERDVSSPLWGPGVRQHLYVEAAGGALLAASFHGGADDRCNCEERSRPLGAMGALRLGFAFGGGFGLELAGGYLTAAERMTRKLKALAQANSDGFQSDDYTDSTTLAGFIVAASASFRVFEKKTPLTARAGLGLASLRSSTANGGTFTGTVRSPDGSSEELQVTRSLAIAERSQRLATPFASTELRLGYRFSRRWSADFGVAAMFFFPPKVFRAGNDTFGGEDGRAAKLEEGKETWANNGEGVRPGVLRLPSETVAGSFVVVSPSIALRVDF